VPVAVRIPGSLEPFDKVKIFLLAPFAKIIRQVQFATGTGGVIRTPVNLRAAPLTFKGALGALKNFPNRQDLALSN